MPVARDSGPDLAICVEGEPWKRSMASVQGTMTMLPAETAAWNREVRQPPGSGPLLQSRGSCCCTRDGDGLWESVVLEAAGVEANLRG